MELKKFQIAKPANCVVFLSYSIIIQYKIHWGFSCYGESSSVGWYIITMFRSIWVS